MTSDDEMLTRWRLILGQFAEENIPCNGDESGETDAALSFLYDREYTEERGMSSDNKQAGRESSVFSVPRWIGTVRKLFPKKACEIMQKQALEKYGMDELLSDPKVLAEAEPDIGLLGKLLAFRQTIPVHVRDMADRVVKKAADEIQKKLETDVRKSFFGKRKGSAAYAPRMYSNFDFSRTVRANLKHYSPEYKTIIPQRLYFYGRVRRYNPWEVTILVDQSGSMADSVIYSAVTAAIFAKLPFIKVRLAVFDTAVVDLSDHTDSAADILMKVQLGGGTDICKALAFAQKNISAPTKSIVILISDLYDSSVQHMYKFCSEILESGVKMFVIPALDYNCAPAYNRPAAKALAKMGAEVGAVTPEGLAQWIGNIVL